MCTVIRTALGQILLILCGVLCLRGYRYITFCLGISDLHIVGEQILGKQPGCQYFLRVRFIENADGRTLRDHFGMLRVKLGNHPHGGLKLHQRILADIRQRSVRTHPGGSGSGINGENTLPGIQEVRRITGDLEGGKGTALYMFGNTIQEIRGGIVEKFNAAVSCGISRVLLL